MNLFDAFIKGKSEQMGKDIVVEIHPHVGMSVDIDELSYEHYSLEEPAVTLPLSLFSVQPCIGKRVVTIHLQPESESVLSVLIAGQTWNFKPALDDAGISGAYFGEGEGRKYFRVMKSVDVTTEEREKITSLVSGVFQNLMVRCVVDSPAEEESHVSELIDELRKNNRIVFV